MAKQVVIQFTKFWGVHYPSEKAAFAPDVAETLIKRGTAIHVETVEGDPAPTAAAIKRLEEQETRGAKGKRDKSEKDDDA